MASIFISYRRDVSSDATGRLHDWLIKDGKIPEGDIFRDIDFVQAGDNFASVIQSALTQAKVALIIVGPGWATVTNERRAPRLRDAGDFVRLEIEEVLRRRIPYIPVLVGGATMPAASQLPPSIAPIALIQALQVDSGADFNRTMEKVRQTLVRYLPTLLDCPLCHHVDQTERLSRLDDTTPRLQELRREPPPPKPIVPKYSAPLHPGNPPMAAPPSNQFRANLPDTVLYVGGNLLRSGMYEWALRRYNKQQSLYTAEQAQIAAETKRAQARWQQELAIWKQLYYCARDDIVFQAGSADHASTADAYIAARLAKK